MSAIVSRIRRQFSDARPAKRAGLVLLALAAFSVVGTSAWAYWITSGSGSGTATTGVPTSVTVQAVTSGTPSSSLTPGGTADLLVQLNNPNTYTVTVVGISQNGTSFNVVGGSGCTSGNSGVSVPSITGLAIALGSGTQVLHIPDGASMTSGSVSGCQGALFQIPVTVAVQK